MVESVKGGGSKWRGKEGWRVGVMESGEGGEGLEGGGRGRHGGGREGKAWRGEDGRGRHGVGRKGEGWSREEGGGMEGGDIGVE